MHEPRRSQIVDYINREGYVSFSTLKTAFVDVSEMTLRTDLKCLDREGRVVRIHGGAKSIETLIRLDDVYNKKVGRNVEKKQQIAQKACRLLWPGASIFIDCGSTLMYFAKSIPDDVYFIVTNNISSMYDLARLTQPDIHMLGGKLNRLNLSAASSHNNAVLKQYNFDIAFIAASAYSAECGFTGPLGVIDESRNIVFERSQKVVVLMDSSKIGRVFPMTTYPTEAVDAIVCDDELPKEMVEHFHNKGITVY